MQDRMDVPDPPLMTVGETLHRRSVELVASGRETPPAKPLREAIVIVDWPLVPVVNEIVVGFALIAKSCM